MLNKITESLIPEILQLKVKLNDNVAKFKIDLIFKILFSTFLLTYLFFKIDFNILIRSLSSINMLWLSIATFTTFLVSLIYVLRLFIILKLFSEITFKDLYLINRLGNLFNFFLVGNLGQEFSKFAYIRDLPKRKLLYLLLFDRLSGFFAMAVVLLSGLHLIPSVDFFPTLLMYFSVLLVNIVLLFSLVLIKNKIQIPYDKFIKSILLSLIYTVGLIFIASLTFKGINITTINIDLIYAVPLLGMILFLPISINGIGLREFVLTNLLTIATESVILYTVIGYAIYVVLNLPGLIYYLKLKSVDGHN